MVKADVGEHDLTARPAYRAGLLVCAVQVGDLYCRVS
jgi:hypothetical protein